MLERLNEIDWRQLRHAYGGAADVPGLIRGLASRWKWIRDRALDKLYGNIWHQGTVYEATAPAVPFLIELVEADSVAGKQHILRLLADLANGHSYKEVHQHGFFQQLRAEEMKTEKWQAELREELNWVKQAADAVKAGEPAYLRLLNHPDTTVRDAAGFLLANIAGPSPQALEAVRRRIEAENDETTKAGLLIALATVSIRDGRTADELSKYLSPNQPKAVQLAAAMALLRTNRSQVPVAAIDVLLAAVRSPAEFSALEKSCWADGHTVVSHVSQYLAILEGPAAITAEGALLKSLGGEKHHQALTIAEALLGLAFNGPIDHGAPMSSLSERQQRVLRAFAANRQIWGVQSGKEFIENVDAMHLMRAHNLPDRFDAFERYLRGETAPPSASIGKWTVAATNRKSFTK
jgi:hypothetical protein